MVLQSLLLYAFVILICKSMQTCYLIKDFNYLFITLPFIVGILFFYLSRKLQSRLSVLPTGLPYVIPFIILVVFLNRTFIFDNINTHIIDNFHLINRSIYTSSPVEFDVFLPFFILLLPLITAFIAAYTSRGQGEIALGILMFIMFSFWNNGFDRIISKSVFFFLLLSILFFAVNQYCRLDRIHRHTGIKIDVDRKRITVYGIAMALIVAVTSMAFTHFFGVKSFFQLKSDYEMNKKRMLQYARDTVYDLSLSGYSANDKKLGGPISLNRAIAFKVKTDAPLYLKGSVKDYYDGYAWKRTSKAYYELGKKSLVSINTAFLRYMLKNPAADLSDSKAKQQLRINKAIIYPESLLTSTLFTPNQTFEVNARREKTVHDDTYAFILLDTSKNDDSYTLRFYESQIGAEIFANLYDAPVGIPYETNSSDPAAMKYYNDMVKKPYAKYLQLPDNLSPRTYSLVRSIIKDCRTRKEKVARIEQYLSSHYPYSLEVSAVPSKQEFIDYFLFTEKKGYCTYFATAATVFCRTAGIPARYVEGFHMNDEKDANNRYIVTNDRSHAWSEVLLLPESGIWSIVDCVPDGAEGAPLPSPTPYRDKFAGDFYQNAVVHELADSTDTGAMDSLDIYRRVWDILVYPFTTIPLLAVFSALIIILYRLYRISRIKKQVLVQQSLVPLYHYTVARLKSIHLGWTSATCELEAAERIDDTVLREAVAGLVKACYREHYGSQEPEPFERLGYFRFIEAYVRKQQSFLYYWYFRLFF